MASRVVGKVDIGHLDVPVTLILRNVMSQHSYNGLVKSFYSTITRWVVRGSPQLSYAQEIANFAQEPTSKILSLVSKELLRRTVTKHNLFHKQTGHCLLADLP